MSWALFPHGVLFDGIGEVLAVLSRNVGLPGAMGCGRRTAPISPIPSQWRTELAHTAARVEPSRISNDSVSPAITLLPGPKVGHGHAIPAL